MYKCPTVKNQGAKKGSQFAGKDVTGDENWLFDSGDDDPDHLATRIGFHSGLADPAEKGQPDGLLDKLSLLDGDSDYGQLNKSEIDQKGSVVKRLKKMKSDVGEIGWTGRVL